MDLNCAGPLICGFLKFDTVHLTLAIQLTAVQLTCTIQILVVQGSTGCLESVYVEGRVKLHVDFLHAGVRCL